MASKTQNETIKTQNETIKTQNETKGNNVKTYLSDTIYVNTSTRAQLTVDHIAELQSAIIVNCAMVERSNDDPDYLLDIADAKEIIASMISKDTATRRTLRTLQRTLMGVGFEFAIGSHELDVTGIKLFKSASGKPEVEYVDHKINAEYIDLEPVNDAENVWAKATTFDIWNDLRHDLDALRDALETAGAGMVEYNFVDAIEAKLLAGPCHKATEEQRLYVVSVPSYDERKKVRHENVTVVGMFFPSKIASQFSYDDPSKTTKAKLAAKVAGADAADAAKVDDVIAAVVA